MSRASPGLSAPGTGLSNSSPSISAGVGHRRNLSYQHYGAFTPAQAYAALSYYFDNREDMDALMAERAVEVDELLKTLGTPLNRETLLTRMKAS